MPILYTISCSACDRVFRTAEELEWHNLGPSCAYRKYSSSMLDYVATVSTIENSYSLQPLLKVNFQVWIDKNSSVEYEKLSSNQHRTFATHLQTLQEIVVHPSLRQAGEFAMLFVQGMSQ